MLYTCHEEDLTPTDWDPMFVGLIETCARWPANTPPQRCMSRSSLAFSQQQLAAVGVGFLDPWGWEERRPLGVRWSTRKQFLVGTSRARMHVSLRASPSAPPGASACESIGSADEAQYGCGTGGWPGRKGG